MFVSLACVLASPSALYLALPCLHTLLCSRHLLAHLAVAPCSQHARLYLYAERFHQSCNGVRQLFASVTRALVAAHLCMAR